MSAFYDPWQTQPRQLPSNFTRPALPGAADGQRGIPSSEVAGVKSDSRQAVIGRAPRGDHADSHSGHAVKNSPTPVVIAVRCAVKPRNAVRLVLPVKPQAKAAPRQGNSREQFKRVLRCLAAPALFSRGPFGRNHNSLGLLARWSSKPLFHLRQEPSSGLAYAFHLLRGLLGLHADQHEGERVPCLTKVLKDRTK